MHRGHGEDGVFAWRAAAFPMERNGLLIALVSLPAVVVIAEYWIPGLAHLAFE